MAVQYVKPNYRSLAIVMMAMAVLLSLAWFASNHAMEKHGGDALLVRYTCQTSNDVIKFVNPSNGRIGTICLTETGMYGVLIQEANGDYVTAFLKEKLKTLDQVIRYMNNAGYILQ